MSSLELRNEAGTHRRGSAKPAQSMHIQFLLLIKILPGLRDTSSFITALSSPCPGYFQVWEDSTK